MRLKHSTRLMCINLQTHTDLASPFSPLIRRSFLLSVCRPQVRSQIYSSWSVARAKKKKKKGVASLLSNQVWISNACQLGPVVGNGWSRATFAPLSQSFVCLLDEVGACVRLAGGESTHHLTFIFNLVLDAGCYFDRGQWRVLSCSLTF